MKFTLTYGKRRSIMSKHMKKILIIACLTFLLCGVLIGAGIAASGAETPDEYIYSESFETAFNPRPSGWSITGSPRIEQSSDKFSEGNYSLKLTDSSTSSSGGLRSPQLPIEKGKYYNISIDVYNETGNATAYVEFFDSSLQRTDNVSSTATSTGKWTTLSFSVCMPDSASYATVLLYSGVANKGIMYFDNIRISEDTGSSDTELIDFDVLNSSYPRLYFDSAELENLKKLTTDGDRNVCGFVGSEVYASLIKEADALLTKSSFSMTYYGSTKKTYSIPFVEQHFTDVPGGYGNSNYPYWQEMGNEMKNMMQTLSLAYSLTGNTAYADRAVELMMSLCSWSTWTEYPTINRTSLETGYFVTGVSTVYDMCYDRLSSSQKTEALTALKEKGLSKLYADLSAFTDHNYYVNKASALAIGSCLMLGGDEDAGLYLSRAYSYIKWYLDERLSSESQEGLSYTSYSMDLIYSALDSVNRVTGKNELITHDYADVALLWAVMSSENAEGSGPPISDVYNNAYFYITLCTLGSVENNGLAGWYINTRNFDVTDFNRLVYYREDLSVEEPLGYSERTGINLSNGVIPNVGWGVLRTGWGADDMLMVCVANNSSQGHSHYDQNSFVLSFGGSWLLSDPGYQDYGAGYASDYSLSYGHSTILIDGKSQDYKGGGKLTALMDSAAFSYLSGEVTGAYAEPTEFDRGFIMVNHSGASYYVISDDIKTSGEHTYSWVLNAENIISFRTLKEDGSLGYLSKGGTVNSDRFVLSGKTGALAVSFDRSLGITYSSWNDVGSIITATDNVQSSTGAFCAVISPVSGTVSKDSVNNAVKVSESYSNDSQNGVRTTYGDSYSDIILISKGTGVSGAGLESDGTSASLFGLRNKAFSGYSATDATSLTYNGKKLIEASAPVSATIYFDSGESVVTGTPGTSITLYLPFGVENHEIGADGLCTIVLSEERTVLDVGEGRNEEEPDYIGSDSDDTQNNTAEPTDTDSSGKKGCRSDITTVSAVTILGIIFVSALLLVRNRKKQ